MASPPRRARAPAAASTAARAAALLARPFTRSLLLPQVFALHFGLRPDALARLLAGTSPARDAAGISGCARALQALAASSVPADTLLRWDLALGRHEAALRDARLAQAAALGDTGTPFVLTHFQWLACAVVEWHLEGLAADAAAHVAAIEAVRADLLPQLSPYTPADARKLACFMATGAGKTLVLHMNLRQFLAHGLFEAQNILLLTPGEGLSAQHQAELQASGLAGLGVRVTEITKFYVDGRGHGRDRKRPKKGVSEATSRYEGPNLLLVDEGHKGGSSAGAGDDSEQGWRLKREALAQGATEAQAGFTFEYSATFAQIAAKDASLYDDYARCISIDFGYARFWREGYGKQPRLLNAAQASGADFALVAGLLAFYQQRRVFDTEPALAHEFAVAPPLLACVGKDVTAGDGDADVAVLVRFLARACAATPWLGERLAEVLASARPVQAGIGLPALDFRWLREAMDREGQSPAQLADDLRQRVFGGAGVLELRLVSDKELGLKSRGAAGDAYFGVVRVGEARKLAEQLVRFGVAAGGEPDRLAGSLFGRLDIDPRLSVLIGAKMFVEGWSSWRVSALALMNVGKSPGSEIVQLFGRGVRLRGKGHSLKRDDDAPLAVQVLQGLQLFGVRADYMQQYLETLQREGVQPQTLYVPVQQAPAIGGLGLHTLQADEARFAGIVVFDGQAARAQHQRVAPALQASVGLGPAEVLGPGLVQCALAAHWLAPEQALQHALAIKQRQGWTGLVVNAGALGSFLARCTVEAPAGHFDAPGTGPARRAQAARLALEAGLSAAWRDADRRWRMQRLAVTALHADNAGLPWQEVDGQRQLAWRLELDVAQHVARSLLEVAQAQVAQGLRDSGFVDRLMGFLASEEGSLQDVAQRLEELLARPDDLHSETLAAPLPRLHVPQHLYAPLLVDEIAPTRTGPLDTAAQLPLFASDRRVPLPLRISPPALNRGEAQFMWDLRAFWQQVHATPRWHDAELFVLRNPAAGGLLLYRGSGFAPDFMLWLKRGGRQALGLVDPKGLAMHWPDDKLALIDDLARRSLSLPVRGFLVSVTGPDQMALPPGQGRDAAALKAVNVLLQSDTDYISHILHTLDKALTTASMPEAAPPAPHPLSELPS
ncbi:MAG: hypothetical protein A3E25_09690 [Burkholderiales bacterium RIFCSPHIGHO2_12_FULL_69_20]|nr:MAG: hypothetical protein A3E25_09690 [Burkholderiales bacterium RIFCSPHIGHO2_12_FULL_69_20]